MFVSEDRPSRRTTDFLVNRAAVPQSAALCYGRFLQADPLGHADSMNLYGYVKGDPINLVDPWGLSSCPRGMIHDTSGQCAYPVDGRRDDPPPPVTRDEPSGPSGPSDNTPATPDPVVPKVVSRINCNSVARKFADFAGDASDAAGGSAVVFAVLGAEPVAGILAATSLFADGAKALAGIYIARTEGDYGPLGSSISGQILGAAAGTAVKAFGGRFTRPFSGVTVSYGASSRRIEAGKFAGSLAGGAIGKQICK